MIKIEKTFSLMASLTEVVTIPTITQYKPSLRETTSSKWNVDAPSSIIFHPSMKSPEGIQISGILIALIIIIIAVLIGFIIWIIYLIITNSKKSTTKAPNN